MKYSKSLFSGFKKGAYLKLLTKVIKPSEEKCGKKWLIFKQQLGEIVFWAKPEVTEKRVAFAVWFFFPLF